MSAYYQGANSRAIYLDSGYRLSEYAVTFAIKELQYKKGMSNGYIRYGKE